MAREHGGKRKGAGRKPRPPLVWPAEFHLASKESWIGFLRHLAQVTYEDKLSERASSAINNTMRLLADGQAWITKTPLQIIQAQMAGPGMITEREVQELLEALPLEQQLDVWKKFKERRGLRPNMASGSTG